MGEENEGEKGGEVEERIIGKSEQNEKQKERGSKRRRGEC